MHAHVDNLIRLQEGRGYVPSVYRMIDGKPVSVDKKPKDPLNIVLFLLLILDDSRYGNSDQLHSAVNTAFKHLVRHSFKRHTLCAEDTSSHAIYMKALCSISSIVTNCLMFALLNHPKSPFPHHYRDRSELFFKQILWVDFCNAYAEPNLEFTLLGNALAILLGIPSEDRANCIINHHILKEDSNMHGFTPPDKIIDSRTHKPWMNAYMLFAIKHVEPKAKIPECLFKEWDVNDTKKGFLLTNDDTTHGSSGHLMSVCTFLWLAATFGQNTCTPS